MKIIEINGTNYSSTGNIMMNIASQARNESFEVFTCCKNSKKSQQFNYDNQIYIGTRIERIISEKLAEYTGYHNYFNVFGTYSFINKLKEIKPDLIHLHVVHDTYINLSMLFKYIKEYNIPVIWTFHDCFAFTGRCPYFELANCFKWKEECYECPQLSKYPETKIDKSKLLWNKKKEWFSNISNLTIVTPSKWLANYAKQSFLKENHIEVINNGIDLNVFKKVDNNFKYKYNLENQYIVLGVGYIWSERKGLDAFIELSKRLPKEYQIVLVGTNGQVDKLLPNNIISIHRTYNVQELVEIYNAADVFVNPTLEDNFPTVNIESLACGTPVITYKTGGSPESIDNKCGIVVEQRDIDGLENAIYSICENKEKYSKHCIEKAKEYDAKLKFKEYVDLYKKVLG